MGRLTKKHGKIAVQIGGETRRNDIGWLRLAQYEDMEEQGRLVEVRYGEWKPVLFDSVCSLCGYSETTPLMIMRRDFKYCPNCGAKMGVE